MTDIAAPLPPTPTVQAYAAYRGTRTPIVLDLGGAQIRAGWAGAAAPAVVFSNQVARYQPRNAPASTYYLVGNEIELVSGSGLQPKPMFENGVLVNPESLEWCLDYTFHFLGIDTPTVDHPILVTEPLGNPVLSRKAVTELLFEAYGVPAVAYACDALLAYHYATTRPSAVLPPDASPADGLVMMFGHETTTLVPILDDRPRFDLVKRIDWGGQQSHEFLHRVLQFKYPSFPQHLSDRQLWGIIYHHCYTALSFDRALMRTATRTVQTHTIQFPFIKEPARDEAAVAAAMAAVAEKRREQGRRLQETSQRLRREKLAEKEAWLARLEQLERDHPDASKDAWQASLKAAGLKSAAEFQQDLESTREWVMRTRQRVLGEKPADEPAASRPPVLDLIDVPDAELDDAGRKEKRKQKMLKGLLAMRERQKVEKALEREAAEKQRLADEQELRTDRVGWIARKRALRRQIRTRMNERQQRRTELADRRSQTSVNRAKHIAHLAAAESGRATKRRRRGGDEGANDTFGANDDDWGIYRDIRRADDAADVEDDEADAQQLEALEQELQKHDPDYAAYERREALREERPWIGTIYHRFLYGRAEFEPENTALMHQLRLNVERVRIGELLFQPYALAGLDQAGLVECVAAILAPLTPAEQTRVLCHVRLVGGGAQLRGVRERLEAELRRLRPTAVGAPDIPVHVLGPDDARLDAWRGGSLLAADPSLFAKLTITRHQYRASGSTAFTAHRWGNRT
ncbi:hypothetical protein CXG81DRAFT_11117 [Caulochytrium protostelioides]|uniref:Actin-like ATPase domain-containing protein n=1 Tax=Caulochytrium protostelioides TaxID=1555241 RepID=A0A4P9XA23_9FUNG|nr:hypothetical protein CXG81DRAFT_11117 [Caulochytrium protostelioides]|eukprot:RKP02162.1 hypothetical protein CXG81DRAFT_11117 [Caulochytrium protostelioides]